ncbi:glycoside hydrolase superfamily [Massariosphaeria phaeospora]|uniref:Beta-hexosaminidase n=1 Tax=Massariosphaeria phaeospora TaxID=100035 RepID=A0A7C8MJC9_9PLEO|nr:glycoside hydrolase superfamily [Massariosphaeria phaeospora]
MKALLIVPLFLSLATALWPIPTEYSHGNTVLWISDNVEFSFRTRGAIVGPQVFDGYQAKQQWIGPRDYDSVGEEHDAPTGADIIHHAIKSARETIFERGLYPWKFRPREWEEPQKDNSGHISTVQVKLLQSEDENPAKPLAGKVDESYKLTLTEAGEATILANSSVGIVRGLTTFTQLFYEHSHDGIYTPLAPIEIFDAPKFQHRSLNLDVSRNWFPTSDIKRTIDALAYNKMNRFHLHITDSQSWPLEIPSLPDLAKKGAYRPDLVYTVEDFREMQYYAAIRGVELITEIDMPGHTSSVHHSYPDLIAAYNIQPDWSTYSAEPPSGTLKLNSSAVDAFLETLLADLLPRVYPFSSHFHTGGDEVNKNAYLKDDTVRSNDPSILQPLMQAFIDRTHKHVRDQGLTPIVWEEMLLEWNLTLGADVIVQSWRSDQAVADIVAKGHKALVGNYKYWYLDCGKGQWLDFPPSSATSAFPYLDYCAPFHNWRAMYAYDPLTNIPPNTAAAEVLWSGAKDAQGRNRSQVEVSLRLGGMRERMVRLGVQAEVMQMPFCSMECTMGSVF